MKLIYADAPVVDSLVFRKLILLGSDVTLVQRPSIQFEKDFGTVGMPTNIDEINKVIKGGPVRFSSEVPPDTIFSSEFYRQYFVKDLENNEFIQSIIEGLKHGWFHGWHLDPQHNHSGPAYKDFKAWIIANSDRLQNIDYSVVEIPPKPFHIHNDDEAFFAFKTMVSEASLRVTSVLTVAEKTGGNPISLNPYLDKLISLRLSNEIYTGSTFKQRSLGIKLLESMIPDEAFFHIPLEELISFREKIEPYHRAWEIEMNKLEAEYLMKGMEFTNQHIQLVIDHDINPKIEELKKEIRNIRDELFYDVLKILKNLAVSSIAGGTLSAINIPAAVASFLLANIKTPHLTDQIIDYSKKIKQARNGNGYTYLLTLEKKLRLD